VPYGVGGCREVPGAGMGGAEELRRSRGATALHPEEGERRTVLLMKAV